MTRRTTLARNTVASVVLAMLLIVAWFAIHIGGIFIFDLKSDAVIAVPVLILIQAWLSTGLFIIAHDCMHGSLAPGWPRLHTAVGTFCVAAYAGLSYRGLYPSHHQHHAAPGTAADPDFHPDAPRNPFVWFLSFFRNYYTHGQLIRITLAAVIYLALGADLLNIVLFWAVPAVLALVQLFVFGTYLPHRHDDAGFADHHNARNLQLSSLGSLLTCFHFGGYHHEHHLSPSTPWWLLPRTRDHDRG